MSHTSTVKGIQIVNAEALASAATELKARGVNCELVRNTVPRAYYNNQIGECPFVLRLNDGPYDVGFVKQPEGHYDAQCDFYAGHIEKELGAPGESGRRVTEQDKLGKFFNAYSTQAVIQQAASQGYQCHRETADDGTVTLRLTQ